MAISPETIFTRDILGRYVCNTFTEAMNSGPFDVIIIGGGTFGLALAQDLYFRSKRFDRGLGNVPQDVLKPSNFRVLVLEAGRSPSPSIRRTFRVSGCSPLAPSRLPTAHYPLRAGS